MSGKGIAGLVATAALCIFGIMVYVGMFYTVDAGDIAVFQRPFTGTLECKTAPGTYLKMGSTVEIYKRRDQYVFAEPPPNSREVDNSIKVQFNDGGVAHLSGVVSWEMPLDCEHILALHQKYRSQEAIDQRLVRVYVNTAMTLTGPIMSSTESFAARRSEYLTDFADQLEHGVYKTEQADVVTTDPITNERKTVRAARIITGSDGKPIRQEASAFQEFGITVLPPSITNIHYEDDVQHQISAQREKTMAIQTAQADARLAEQRAYTAQKNGEANAAEAKWKQEVEKATAVTKAEQDKAVQETNAARDKDVAEIGAKQRLEVATLDAQAAGQEKQANILRGEGESQRRQLVMAADGALDAKLKAYTAVNEIWANAFSAYRGQIVPQIVSGGGNGMSAADNGFQQAMQAVGIKALKDLALDTSLPATAPAKAR